MCEAVEINHSALVRETETTATSTLRHTQGLMHETH